MRHIIISTLVLLSFLLVTAQPVSAYSELAEHFLRDVRQLDISFPPSGWTDEDLRQAATEVLDSWENGTGEAWTVNFCLLTLGHVRNPEDLPRILAYEDDMTQTVLQSLKGFPHPDAIDCLLRWLEDDSASNRELAILGLKVIDFDEMEDPDTWIQTITDELQAAREVETEEFLRDTIDEALTVIEAEELEDE